MKNKQNICHTGGLIQKSNINIVERYNIDNHNTQIYEKQTKHMSHWRINSKIKYQYRRKIQYR